MGIIGLLLGYKFAEMASENYGKLTISNKKMEILNSIERKAHQQYSTKDEKGAVFHFLAEYEYLSKLAIDYLRLRGYGINAQSPISLLAGILKNKSVFTEEDVVTAMKLREIRNKYAHGLSDIEGAELKRSLHKTIELQEKVKNALVALNSDSGS